MEPDSPFAEPVSSFQFPVTPPTVEPGASPLETIQINSSWLELLRGCAKQLLLQSTWKTQDSGQINLAQERAFNLIDLLQDQGGLLSVPTGSILGFGGSSAPGGFLLCDGTAVSRTTYAALFTVVGTTYGVGDGSTTFNLPDLRSRSPVGAGQHPGLSNRALGATGGEETHALSVAELAVHSHSLQYTTLAHVVDTTAFMTSGPDHAGTTTGNTGSGTAHNTMHPFQVIEFIIKT